MDFHAAPAAEDHPRKRKRRKKTKGEENLKLDFYVVSVVLGYSRKTRKNKQGEKREDLIIGF